MTFKHKLARRLALVRSESPRTALLVASILVAGCLDQAASTAFDPGIAEDPAGVKEPAALSIAPTSLTLEIDQPAQFKANSAVEWVVDGGAISKEGVFTSKSTGTFRVVGKDRGRPHWRDTAIVVVVPTQPVLARVVISPERASAPAGGTLAFTASGRLADGSTVPIGVTWSASGGSIDAGGNFAAGSTVGEFHVIARHSGGKADTSFVSLVKAEVVPPPPTQPAPSPTPGPTPTPAPPAPTPAPSPSPIPIPGALDFSRPAGPLPTTADDLVALGIVGPTLTAAKSAAMGSMFATFESRWVQFAETHWNDPSDRYGNYYDRAYNHYALWARTGDPKWRQRADAIALNYRTTYLEPNNYGSSPHNAQLEGVFLHYWLTGDMQSRKAVVETARILGTYSNPNAAYAYQEGRIQGRGLLAVLLACQLRDTSADWCAKADQFIENWIALQQADGSFRYRLNTEDPNGPMGQSNFMEGIRADAAIKYYYTRKQDPRVATMVRRMADYMSTQWNPTAGTFKYHSVNPTASATLADLNHMIVQMFGFAWKVSGQQQYRAIGDAAFDAGEPGWTAAYISTGAGEFLTGSKQFNEHYYSSFRYLALRQ